MSTPHAYIPFPIKWPFGICAVQSTDLKTAVQELSAYVSKRCWWPVQADIQAFRNRERPPKKTAPVDCSQHHADSVPDFLNGRVLRDYQTVSLHWMMENFRKKRSCILGDEMVCPL